MIYKNILEATKMKIRKIITLMTIYLILKATMISFPLELTIDSIECEIISVDLC